MFSWPCRRAVVRTELPPDAVMRRLSEVVGPPALERLRASDTGGQRPFEGTVDGTRFAFSRFELGLNPFAPRVEGVVVPETEGSRLEAELRPSGAGAMLGFGLVAGLVALALLEHGNGAEPGAWRQALVFAGAVVAWMVVGFHAGCRSVCGLLDELGTDAEA